MRESAAFSLDMDPRFRGGDDMGEGSSLETRLDKARPRAVPPVLKRATCEAASQLCAERCGEKLRAIVLTGSLARDEATFVCRGERWRLWGDAEFLLVFDQDSELPSPFTIDRLERDSEHRLLEEGLSAHVELTPVHTGYLRKMPPEIFAYELRTHGQVVWGDRRILSLIPAFSPRDIPLEDGWRMLCNRVVEFLEAIDPVVEEPAEPAPDCRYRVVKLYLDMATSFLLFRGAYAPTYRERAERLSALAAEHEMRTLDHCHSPESGNLLAPGYSHSRESGNPGEANANCPFPLREFAQMLAYCTQLKLQPDEGVGAPPAAAVNDVRPSAGEATDGMFSLAELVTYARKLWRWELERLTWSSGTSCRTPTDRELMRRWMRLQPVRKRLRGWASTLRRSGWHRSWRHWPRWAQLGWRGSPRYWVYAAACDLFFRLPGMVNGDGLSPEAESELESIRSCLPLPTDSLEIGRNSSWRQVAAAIARNYQAFLRGTRT